MNKRPNQTHLDSPYCKQIQSMGFLRSTCQSSAKNHKQIQACCNARLGIFMQKVKLYISHTHEGFYFLGASYLFSTQSLFPSAFASNLCNQTRQLFIDVIRCGGVKLRFSFSLFCWSRKAGKEASLFSLLFDWIHFLDYQGSYYDPYVVFLFFWSTYMHGLFFLILLGTCIELHGTKIK